MKKKVTVTLLAVVPLLVMVSPAYAFSDHDEVYLPNTNIQLQANAWSQSVISGGKFDWATSSKATVNGERKNVETIRNTAILRAEGINVGISNNGLSASGAISSEVTHTWTNTNSWISDLSGRGAYTGLVWRVTVNSTAFAFHNGVKKTVSVWSW